MAPSPTQIITDATPVSKLVRRVFLGQIVPHATMRRNLKTITAIRIANGVLTPQQFTTVLTIKVVCSNVLTAHTCRSYFACLVTLRVQRV